jgi:virginiamycin B lyase
LNGANALARVTVDGEVRIVDLPTAAAPVGIASGDGALWATCIGSGHLVRVDPAGQVTEFALPDPDCRPHALAAGAEGCWFTEWGANRIGHIDWDGHVEEFVLPPGPAEPHGVAVGSDDTVWVAFESGRAAPLTPRGGSGGESGAVVRLTPR